MLSHFRPLLRSSIATLRRTSSTMSASSTDYAHLSREDLIARLSQLERTDASTSAGPSTAASSLSPKVPGKKQSKKAREAPTPASQSEFFDRYPSRKIALRFCYEGWLYGGLALQNEDTPLPTVEGVLLEALVKARLIKNANDLEEIDFSRCGRTDRGVSAAGQVVSLYVRSQLRPEEGQHEKGWRPAVLQASAIGEEQSLSLDQEASLSEQKKERLRQKAAAKNRAREELPYMHLLNRALPSSIRILAWSPVLPDFDSRFSCIYRRYKYFFSSDPSSSSQLDIDAMRAGASKLVGEHDFRNLCKVDATTQITNFRRRVISATISQLPTPPGQQDIMYVFDLQGTAFLYHQVRHIMAILFLVGSGKERPDIVDKLLNTGYADEKNIVDDTALRKDLAKIPSKPAYEMADDLPLVLWDCAFPEGACNWQQDGQSKQSFGMQEHNMRHRLKATISEHFSEAFESFASKATPDDPSDGKYAAIQIGAGRVITTSRYISLVDRPRSQLVEDINARWAEGQGKRRADRRAKEAQEMVTEE